MSIRAILLVTLFAGLVVIFMGLAQRTSEIERGPQVTSVRSDSPQSSDKASRIRLNRQMFPVGPLTFGLCLTGFIISLAAGVGLLIQRPVTKRHV